MIYFTPRVVELLNNPRVQIFYCVSIGNEHHTTLYSEVTIGGITYLPTGRISALDPPQMTSTVDREVYKISLINHDMSMGLKFDNGMVGTPVTVIVGFVDPVTNLPETNAGNTFIVYSGEIDSTSCRIDSSNGESTSSISCTSPMNSLDLTRGFYSSRESIRAINGNDSCFDQIYEGAGQVFLYWGKV